MVPIYSITSKVSCDHLVTVVPARFLHGRDAVIALVINKYFREGTEDILFLISLSI